MLMFSLVVVVLGGSPGGVPTGCHYKMPEIKQAWMDAHELVPLEEPRPIWSAFQSGAPAAVTGGRWSRSRSSR
jgi:hypothetical protein